MNITHRRIKSCNLIHKKKCNVSVSTSAHFCNIKENVKGRCFLHSKSSSKHYHMLAWFIFGPTLSYKFYVFLLVSTLEFTGGIKGASILLRECLLRYGNLVHNLEKFSRLFLMCLSCFSLQLDDYLGRNLTSYPQPNTQICF